MEKQFVPYELAVKLKELGFDEECFAFYLENRNGNISLEFGEGTQYRTHRPYENVRYDKITNSHSKTFENRLYNCRCTSPIWQQAFDWFREKYGLFHFEDHRCNSHDGNSKIYWFGIKQFKEAPFGSIVKVGLIELGCFKTYESARLACLEKLIELTTPSIRG